jgi:putative solute:sodium symporter small subunit|tara:strand:- start:390 stop:644 length:255 start_codon:yes stop_codon:yes gene_type:complete
MDNRTQHWADTKSLMFKTLGIWFIFSIAIHAFAGALNGISFLGFPLGYYMAAQGSLIVFVVTIFWSTSQQEKIDEKYGLAEEDQ